MRPIGNRRATAALALALSALALAACGRGGDSRDEGLTTRGPSSPPGPVASPSPATPDLASVTKNTARVEADEPVEVAAAVASIVYPSDRGGDRPDAVALADVRDWRAAVTGAVLMAPPLRAPLLLTDAGEIPAATAAAIKRLSPRGSSRAGGAQAVRLGTAGSVPGLRITSIAGDDPFTLAARIAEYRARLAGRYANAVVVVGSDSPELAAPAAAWAAKSGDPVLFATRTTLPTATRRAIRAHGRPRIYVLGSAAAVGDGVRAQLSRLGTVTRLAARTPQAAAVAFARFSEGAFGWGVSDPGHGFVFAAPGRPALAGAAAALSASGSYGPLLLLDDDGGLPAVVRDYLLDVKPGYSRDPVRGVYNHAWIVGAAATVPFATQAEIDGLLEIAPVPPPPSEP
ncbi:MAG: cell wall-binding repeat-containing protein [Solirubrobacteraceae bacterium]|nr:cell wall-binding repeat-containing protein [Solirubrobacteraceae bacterium]